VLYYTTPALCNTQYVNENKTLVVQSVQPCHLYGDSDIYGIGIRISLYLQWAALIPALVVGVEKEIKNARRAFNVVALAVLINTLISAAGGSFAILEMFIVISLVPALSIYFALPFGGPINIKAWLLDENKNKPQAKVTPPRLHQIFRRILARILSGTFDFRKFLEIDAYKKDQIGIGITLLIYAMFLLAQPWLNFVILRQGRKNGCSPKIWLFGRIDLYNGNWVRWLRVVSIFGVIFGSIFLILAVITLAYGYVETLEETSKKASKSNSNAPREDGNQGPQNQQTTTLAQKIYMIIVHFWKSLIKNFIRWAVLAFGPFIIAFIEMTITVNNIDMSNAPITATSQLLALLVGIFSAASLLWASLWKIRGIIVQVNEEYAKRQQADRTR